MRGGEAIGHRHPHHAVARGEIADIGIERAAIGVLVAHHETAAMDKHQHRRARQIGAGEDIQPVARIRAIGDVAR